jgi:carboxyl-terminal processing protease
VIIGTAKKGAVMTQTGKQANWVRVALADGTPGFIAATSVSSSSGNPTSDAFTPRWQVTPPQIALQVPSQESIGDRYTLSGSATDDNHLEDVFILVSNRDSKIEGKKVFYSSARGKKSDKKLDFSAKVPLWPGNNLITVIARENNEVKAIQSLWVLRSDRIATAGATPKPTNSVVP